ncbi:MAG: glycosyltransferase, partial [Candidatus Omnitrophica bacterium]|nr:glycosyltransferase [Candidatus Omnitrophota bacterium]
DGPMRPALEQQARVLGLLLEGVKFCGQVYDVRSVYQKADILILTSEYEGMPNVVLEAMASALPVVSAAVGGVGEIVQHNVTGYLVERGNENGFIDALLTLINNEQLRIEMGQRAREYVKKQYSLKLLPQILKNLYHKVLSK